MHRVYCFFMLNKGWQCQFLLPDLKTTAAHPITFADPAKIVEMAERSNALKDLAARQAVDYGISMERGSVWLYLSDKQYEKLKRGRWQRLHSAGTPNRTRGTGHRGNRSRLPQKSIRLHSR